VSVQGPLENSFHLSQPVGEQTCRSVDYEGVSSESRA
jgi:hypothetical protein